MPPPPPPEWKKMMNSDTNVSIQLENVNKRAYFSDTIFDFGRLVSWRWRQANTTRLARKSRRLEPPDGGDKSKQARKRA